MPNARVEESEPSCPLVDMDDNMAIFGTINSELSSEWCQRVDSALETGAQTMPLMEQKDRVAKLVDSHLRPAYWKSIDVAEIYAGNHIFSIAKLSKSRREQVTERFLANCEIQSSAACSRTKEDHLKSNASKEDESIEIPSQSDVEHLQEACTALQEKLKALKHSRMSLLANVSRAEATVSVTNQDFTTFPTAERVQKFVAGLDRLRSVQADGSSLTEALDNKQKEKSVGVENNENVAVTFSAYGRTCAETPRSFEVQLKRDKQLVGTQLALRQLSNMLHGNS